MEVAGQVVADRLAVESVPHGASFVLDGCHLVVGELFSAQFRPPDRKVVVRQGLVVESRDAGEIGKRKVSLCLLQIEELSKFSQRRGRREQTSYVAKFHPTRSQEGGDFVASLQHPGSLAQLVKSRRQKLKEEHVVVARPARKKRTLAKAENKKRPSEKKKTNTKQKLTRKN